VPMARSSAGKAGALLRRFVRRLVVNFEEGSVVRFLSNHDGIMATTKDSRQRVQKTIPIPLIRNNLLLLMSNRNYIPRMMCAAGEAAP